MAIDQFYAKVIFDNGEIYDEYFDNQKDAITWCQTLFNQERIEWCGVYDDFNDRVVWEWSPQYDIIFD